jgi:hypothetical protein
VISRFRLILGRPGKPRDEPGASSGWADNPSTDSKGTTYAKDSGIKPGGGSEPDTREAAGSSGTGFSDAEHERATAALRKFLLENHTNVDRALRLRDRADRLESEGTPSDSARNRASRARQEVVAGLVRLRRSLAEFGAGSARALDLEVTRMTLRVSPDEIRR